MLKVNSGEAAAKLKELVIEQNIKVHAKEAAVYEKIHPQLFNWYHQRKCRMDVKFILEKLEEVPDIQVLDLGCGTGFLIFKIIDRKNVKKITAVDLSREMLLELKGKLIEPHNDKVLIVQDEAVSFLSSNKKKYDLIMTSALLHHLVDIDEMIQLCLQSLKSGGIFYIAYEPLKQPIDSRVRFAFHRMVRSFDQLYFKLNMHRSGIFLDKDHESTLADYQTTLGGIEPGVVLSALRKSGSLLKFNRFATRANGVLAFFSDRILKSQNTFSVIFNKR